MRGLALTALLLAASTAFASHHDIVGLQRLAQTQPASARNWDRLGEALAREHRFAEAYEALNRALKLAPADKRARHHLALAYAWAGSYTEAERQFQAVLARHPDDFEIRIDYGATLGWDRRYPDARRQFQYVLERDSEHVEALRHLGLLTAWEGRYDEALKLLGRAAARAPDNIHVLSNEGEVLSWKGNLAQALARYERILAISPGNAQALTQIGMIQGWRGNVADATLAFRQAISADPRLLDAHLGLVELYVANHRFADADHTLRYARALFPNEPRLGEAQAALTAQRTLSLIDAIEYLEPVVFVSILLVTHWHLRRYRRVFGRRHRFLLLVFYGLPSLAAIVLLGYVVLLFDIVPYRDAEDFRESLELVSLVALIGVIFVLVWLQRFGQPKRRLTVLAIGAHPDDVEFGCGATLLRLREEGAQTHALVLSRGEMGAPANGSTPLDRAVEAAASGRIVALNGLTVLGFPDARFSAHVDDIKQAIEGEIGRLCPDMIFTHNAADTHSDHRVVHDATREAARGAHSILCYENPNTPPGFHPNYFVDVNDYLNDKIAALARHKSQSNKPYVDADVVRHAAGFRGSQARIKCAEAFEVIRVIDKENLP